MVLGVYLGYFVYLFILFCSSKQYFGERQVAFEIGLVFLAAPWGAEGEAHCQHRRHKSHIKALKTALQYTHAHAHTAVAGFG